MGQGLLNRKARKTVPIQKLELCSSQEVVYGEAALRLKWNPAVKGDEKVGWLDYVEVVVPFSPKHGIRVSGKRRGTSLDEESAMKFHAYIDDKSTPQTILLSLRNILGIVEEGSTLAHSYYKEIAYVLNVCKGVQREYMNDYPAGTDREVDLLQLTAYREGLVSGRVRVLAEGSSQPISGSYRDAWYPTLDQTVDVVAEKGKFLAFTGFTDAHFVTDKVAEGRNPVPDFFYRVERNFGALLVFGEDNHISSIYVSPDGVTRNKAFLLYEGVSKAYWGVDAGTVSDREDEFIRILQNLPDYN